ncbi:MAG: DUF559 domain-containing protein [Mycobacteriaceae bacterium]
MDNWWEVLAEYDGLILRDRVLSAGVDPDQLVTALRTGRLFRVQRGVYGARAARPGPLPRARAAVLSSGVLDAVASHHTAARVHGLAVPDRPAVEHVTVRREQRRVRRRDLHFHSRALGIGDVQQSAGTALTSPARTVYDLAAYLPRLDGVWCIDDALRQRTTTISALNLVREGRLGGRGDALARARIDEADGMAESMLETAGRLALADAGVVLPVAQFAVRDSADRLIARLDGAYLELELAIEFDGQSFHSAPAPVFRDRSRQNALELAGWRVLRFTWWDVVHDTKRFVATVRTALLRASA